MHGDQMEETSTPRTSKKSGWSTGPHDLIAGEVLHKNHELDTDQRPPECNESGSHQALSLAELSIAAQRAAQSHQLAFKVPFVEANFGRHSASRCLKIPKFQEWAAYAPGFFTINQTDLRRRHKPASIF